MKISISHVVQNYCCHHLLFLLLQKDLYLTDNYSPLKQSVIDDVEMLLVTGQSEIGKSIIV